MKALLAGFVLYLALLPATLPASAQASNLGTIDFPNSGAAAAQEPFLRGVLLLHSFEFEDAREAFQEAQKADPGFALAYWGEAMTHNHPLWREQDRDAARKALERLAPTAAARLAQAPTDREKEYLRALEVLYSDGDKVERDLAFSEAMRALHEKYPDDLDAASFYALSILGTTQGERDVAVYMRAAAVAEEVFAKSPQHPGAAHYLIHSYDDPVHAPLGLRAARVYARIAPAASHAQHMISHIYVALGDWDAVEDANVKAFAVSEERARRKGLPQHVRSHHALHWLEYAYLQQGRYQKARQTLDLIEADARSSGSTGARWYFAAMRAAYIVQTGDTKNVPSGIDTKGIGLSATAADLFATGYAAWRAGNPEGVSDALAQLRANREAVPEASSHHHASWTATNSPRDLAVAAIAAKELEALLSWHSGEKEKALLLLEEATAAEDALPIEFGPPDVVKPTHELRGEFLLQFGKTKEAQEQFELALKRTPRRSPSLLGLARAADQAGDRDTADKAYAELRQIWQKADAGLAELEEVNVKASRRGAN